MVGDIQQDDDDDDSEERRATGGRHHRQLRCQENLQEDEKEYQEEEDKEDEEVEREFLETEEGKETRLVAMRRLCPEEERTMTGSVRFGLKVQGEACTVHETIFANV